MVMAGCRFRHLGYLARVGIDRLLCAWHRCSDGSGWIDHGSSREAFRKQNFADEIDPAFAIIHLELALVCNGVGCGGIDRFLDISTPSSLSERRRCRAPVSNGRLY